MAFPPLGLAGQRALTSGKALIVGVGGLGSWAAELLARAGVGFLRLVDNDKVDFTNIHRQGLYGEADAAARKPKALAAAERLKQVNADVAVEPVVARLDKNNIYSLTDGVGVILDGTDNFATRFLLNDYAVKFSRPWVFAGVVGAEAQTMTIVPGQTPCLRCVLEAPPPPCVDPSCQAAGVIGPAVAMIAAVQAAEAIKILIGKSDLVSPYVTKIDLWNNTVQRIDASASCRDVDCTCCKRKYFDYLDG
jgi:adenylyltransferase/sulfurtransferase